MGKRRSVLLIVCGALSLLPFAALFFSGEISTLSLVVAVINATAWALIAWLNNRSTPESKRISTIASALNIPDLQKGRLSTLDSILWQIERRKAAFSIELASEKINSKEELSRTLESIVAQAFKLFNADSAELALGDGDAGIYHSSFVLGKPFRDPLPAARDINSIAAEGVIIHRIAFAGGTLGFLRVGLKKGQIATAADIEILRLLGLFSGLVLSNSDYTAELARLRKSSDESMQAKTGFLATLSHELRGPLGIIINAVELVLEGLCGEINSDQKETLSMIKVNGTHLLELINDVLDYARAESGKVVPDKSDIGINELLVDIAQVVRTQADQKGHKIIVTPCDEHYAISCDRRHARQMFINLLTNAIKYTPDKGTIVLWAEKVGEERINLFVKDTGVGISKDNRSKVFSAFERIEDEYSRKQVGTGLGMPLTKKLAEANGGELDFESEVGKGTTFRLTFPLVKIDAQDTLAQVDEGIDAAGLGESILLIEEDKNERALVSRYLTSRGFVVFEGHAPDEIVTALRGTAVRVALVDNRLIDSPESEIIATLRRNGSPSLRIVLLSSRAFTFDIERYLLAGVDRCISKPIPLKTLGQICRSLIDGAAAAPRLIKQGREEPRVSVKMGRKL